MSKNGLQIMEWCPMSNNFAVTQFNADNKITGEVLIHADHEMLKALNITSVGHRMKILKLVDQLRKKNGLAPQKYNTSTSEIESPGTIYID